MVKNICYISVLLSNRKANDHSILCSMYLFCLSYCYYLCKNKGPKLNAVCLTGPYLVFHICTG